MAGKKTLKGNIRIEDLKGLNFLTSGTNGNIAGLANLPDHVLQQLLPKLIADKLNAISEGVRPNSFLKTINPFADDYTLLESAGAKENLFDLINRAQADHTQLSADETGALESILSATNDDKFTADGTLDANELSALSVLRLKMGDTQLTDIANGNFETQQANAARIAAEAKARADAQAAEAARKAEQQARAAATQQQELQTQASLDAQIEAGLLYSGMLRDGESLNMGLRRFVNYTTSHGNQVSTYNSLVDGNGALNAAAKSYLQTNGNGLVALGANGADLLKADLESGMEDRIARAQNYLNLKGGDIEVNGELTPETFAAGQAAIRAPIGIPEGLIRADGTASLEKMYNLSEAGQLYLPIDALSAEDQIAAMEFPEAANLKAGDVFSREQFIASRLIGDDPQAYVRLVEAENARRAVASLDANLVQMPVVEIEVGTPQTEERVDIAQNPIGILHDNDDFISTDASKIINEHAMSNGIGVTDASGFIVFPEKQIGMDGFVAALTNDKGMTGDGVDDNMISVRGVVALGVESVTGNAGAHIDMDEVQAIEEKLGLLSHQQMDISTIAGRETALQAIVSYADLKTGMQDDLSFGGSRTYQEMMTSIDREDVSAAISGAAKGVNKNAPSEGTPSGPGITEEMLISRADQSGFLGQRFSFAHDNLLVRAPASDPQIHIAGNEGPRQDHHAFGLGS